jgi:hypothetical protein
MLDPNTMHCRLDPRVCRGESYCACQCDQCKAAHHAGVAFYAERSAALKSKGRQPSKTGRKPSTK